MSIVLWDNIEYKGKKPLDSRMLFDTIADMKAYSENYLPDITLAFNKEDSKMYVFNRENDVDTTTGKWREFESADGGTESVYLTQIEYDNLTQEEQDDPTKDYYIISNGQSVPSEGITLADLDDTHISNPTDKQVMQYNGTSEVWENGQLDLATLSDTTISSPKKGQVLKYDSTTEKFVNGAVMDDVSAYKVANTALRTGGWISQFGNWNVWYMIPMFAGDYISVSGVDYASDSNYKNWVIYDSTGAVTQTWTNGVTKTFDADGYISFMSMHDPYTLVVNRSNVTAKKFGKMDKLLLNSYTYTEVDQCADYLHVGYLGTDGSIIANNDWKTYQNVPVEAGEHIRLDSVSTTSISSAKGFIIFDTDGTTIITSWARGAGHWCFPKKVYVSMCYEVRTQGSRKPCQINRIHKFADILTKDEVTPNPTYWTAIGDSITAGNKGNTGNSYSRTAATMLWSDKVSLQNLWYWGHTMKQSAGTAFNSIRTWTKIITINFGSNDIFVLWPSQWWDVDEIIAKDASELAYNVSSFESLRKFIEDCRTSFPEAMVYVITPIKRSTSQSQPDWNTACKKLCDYYSIPVLDAFGECWIRYSDTLYKRDGIHPNDAGCTIFARWLINKINFL